MPDDLVGAGEQGVEEGVGRRRAFACDEGPQAEDGLARHALVGSPRVVLIVAERPPAPGRFHAGDDGLAIGPVLVIVEVNPTSLLLLNEILK